MFRDREAAGKQLAEYLLKTGVRNPVVIALPRGGVPVAYEVAKRLNAPLDVLVTRKIGSPENPEFGIGAVSEDGTLWFDNESVEALRLSEKDLEALSRKEQHEIRRRVDVFRAGRPMESVRGKSVILVDDGLATGVTARASARSLRAQGASQILLAVPVGAPDTVTSFENEVDEVICLQQPWHFQSVGNWYENFSQTSDREVVELLELARRDQDSAGSEREIEISDGATHLHGTLSIPINALGMVIFAHGSGSSRHSPRNIEVARRLNQAGLATLLFDLLDPEESRDRENVFDIPLLAGRLILAYSWIRQEPATSSIPIGFFGASTGAGAALWAAAKLKNDIAAVVSRGGRPDLAMEVLPDVSAPTLLIVGGDDTPVIELNRKTQKLLPGSRLLIVAGATHLFEEPGALEAVAQKATDWFVENFETFRAEGSQEAA